MTLENDNQCPHTLALGTRGWGLTIRCTLNRGHNGVHVGPIYSGPTGTRHVLADDVTALEWRTADLSGTPTTTRGGSFPGSDLDLDLLTVICRIEQCHREGPDNAGGGIVFDRLKTCDVPRLRSYVSAAALEWAKGTPWDPANF